MALGTGSRGAATANHRTLSEIYALHRLGRIARAGASSRRRGIRDALQILSAQLDFQGSEILVDALLALRAGDRDDVLALREEPREHELRWGAFLFRGNGFDALQ